MSTIANPVAATPIALTIAGSDSSGGAGIQADLKTFSALGVYGASVIAALTAQNTTCVVAVQAVPADFISAQIDAVMSDLSVGAIKIGMLGRAEAIEAVARALDRHHARNVVLDPVMVAGTGARLLDPAALAALVRELMPRARVVTPNLPEAAALLDAPMAENEGEMQQQGERLIARGARAVLMKGGHAKGGKCVDLLIDGAQLVRLPAARITTRNTHGTGCTLSAAIAAGLAKGLDLAAAVRAAKVYVTAAIAAADRLTIGQGPGPLHHFHHWW